MKRLLVSLLLVAGACGGATDSSDSTSSSPVPTSDTDVEVSVETEVQAVADAIVAAHGEDGGFDAVIWAFERGYSGDQLFAGALEGRLEADGVITAAAGGTEAPDGSPLGLIALPAPEVESLGFTAVPAVYRADSQMSAALQAITIDEYKDKFGDAKINALLKLLIVATRTGYSGRQIIESVIEGGQLESFDIDNPLLGFTITCAYIRDLTGQVVVPEFLAPPSEGETKGMCRSAISDLGEKEKAEREASAEGEAETSTSSVEIDEPFPWTYEGTASSHSSARLDFGARGSVEYDNDRPFTITLNPDGTVDATWHAGPVTTVGVHCETNPPTGNLSTTPVDARSVELAGTHGDGTFRVTDPSGALDIQGTYTASQIQADWESSVSMAACGDFPDAGNLHLSGTSSLVLDRTSPPAP